MAQQGQQQQQQQQQGPATIATISAIFQTAATPAASYDDRLTDAKIQRIMTQNVNTAGQDFHGYTVAQFQQTFHSFIMLAALNHSNNLSTLPDTVSPNGAPQAITYNRFRDMVKNEGYPFSHLMTTFVTEAYNECRRNNRFCPKFSDLGYTEETKFMAIPCSSKIDPTRAEPKPTTKMYQAANVNKHANITDALQTDQEPISVHHHYIAGSIAPLNRRIGN